MELGRLNEAKGFAQNLQVEENSKTFVHLLQLKGKICLKLGDNEKGILYLNQALSLARIKGMSKDAERLNELLINSTTKWSDKVKGQSTDPMQKECY